MYQAENLPAAETISRTKVLRLGTLNTTQYQPVADLTDLGSPKTGYIHQNQQVAYQQALGKFSARFTNKNTGPVYRFGSYRLVPQDENTARVYFGPSIIDRPTLVDEGALSLNSANIANTTSMVADLAPFVIGLLEENDYMAYLKSKGLLKPDSPFWVEIAMDFYRDRAGTIGFHKDSLDLTIFVGLMFNNDRTINGPEYFYDTTPDRIHQQNVQNKLPDEVLTDIANFRHAKQSEKTIYRSELEPSGWILFTDETVNHSSPTLDSRAISGTEDKDKLLIALEGINIDKNALAEIRRYLSDTSFPDTQKFYPEDIMGIVNDPDMDVKIADIFVSKLNKANLSIVQINDCDPENRETRQPIVDTNRVSCTKDLHPHASRVSPGKKALQRENSDRNLLGNITNQAPSTAPRQFIRLWVQVARKTDVKF